MPRDPRDVELEALRVQLRELLARLDIALAQSADTARRLDVALAQNAELVEQVAKLNERVAELLPAAKRKARKTRPTVPSEAPPPTMTEEQRRAFENRPRPPGKPPKAPAQRSAAKPTGRSALPPHLEAEVHELRPDTCEHCASTDLQTVDVVVEEKLHVVKEHQRRRKVHRKTCRCRKCGQRTTARSLPAPYARSKVTCEWLSWLVYQKFVLLVPLDRIRRDLKLHGVHIAMGTLVSMIERAADILAPVDGVHWQQLLKSRWMATDGTGLKVLVPGLETAHNGYIELYRNDSLAVFQYEPDKAAENLLSKLRPFQGTLVADAEHRYNDLYLDGRVIEGGCNAHPRRKFRDAEGAQPLLAAEGGAFLGAMYGEEEKAKQLRLRADALFAGSSEGAHRACVLLGIAATCRALGVSALRYMTWAFERLGTHRDLYGLTAADITPAAFAADHR